MFHVLRWSVVAACVSASACLGHVVGSDFHAKYAGQCASSTQPFGSDVEQAGARWQAARDHLVIEIEKRGEALRRCYTEALANVKSLHGRVVLRLTLAPSGRIDQIAVSEDAPGYEPLACCVVATVNEIAWQPSAAIGLEYPFTFELVRMPLGYRESMSADFAFMEVLPTGYRVVLDGAMHGGGPVR